MHTGLAAAVCRLDAQHGARRFADDGVAVGAEAAEETFVGVAAEDDEIGVNGFGHLPDDLGGFAGDDMHFDIDARFGGGLFDALLEETSDFDAPGRIDIVTGSGSVIGTCVHDMEGGSEGLRQFGPSGDEVRGTGVDVRGDQDGAYLRDVAGGGFDVGAGEDGNGGVTQYLGRDGTEQEAAEGAVAVGADHDEVGMPLAGNADDLGGGIAFAEERGHFAAGEMVIDEIGQLFFQERALLRIPIEDDGGGNIDAFGSELEGAHDMNGDDGRAVLVGQDTGVGRGDGGTGGEIDGQDDGLWGSHKWLRISPSTTTIPLQCGVIHLNN